MQKASRIPMIAFLVAAFSLPIAAQPNRPTELATPTKRPSAEATNCHAQLASLEGKASPDFDGKPLEELQALFDSIDTCVRDSYSALPKFDLVLATVVTGWLQSAIDAKSVLCPGSNGNPGRSTISQEPIHTAPHQGPAATKGADVGNPVLTLTSGNMSLFPLNVGQYYYYSFGGIELNCSTKTTETMSCYESGSTIAVSYVGAIVAQNGREYL
jgi:hypothetical protein